MPILTRTRSASCTGRACQGARSPSACSTSSARSGPTNGSRPCSMRGTAGTQLARGLRETRVILGGKVPGSKQNGSSRRQRPSSARRVALHATLHRLIRAGSIQSVRFYARSRLRSRPSDLESLSSRWLVQLSTNELVVGGVTDWCEGPSANNDPARYCQPWSYKLKSAVFDSRFLTFWNSVVGR